MSNYKNLSAPETPIFEHYKAPIAILAFKKTKDLYMMNVIFALC